MASRAFLTALVAGAAIASPLKARDSCSAAYGQCGGTGWAGPTCCASGSTCTPNGAYYSQCLPPNSGGGGSDPTTSSVPSPTTTIAPSGTVDWTGNPYDIDLWANNFYKAEVTASAIPKLSGAMASAAAAVAEVPSYLWLDTFNKTTAMSQTYDDIVAAGGTSAAQFVVYDLPDRDCSAGASNGEYSVADGGVAKYKTYIDTIAGIIKKNSDVRTLLIIEPDSLGNLVTNLNAFPKCAAAADAYIECVTYAVQNLNLPNVAMYLDAAHSGWLGWPANQEPAAKLFASIYVNASAPASLRGLATNVANYNAWSLTTAPSYTQGNPVFDEKTYIHALSPLLAEYGWVGAKFITEQSRSGQQPTGQIAEGDWCNALGTGFGTRPTAKTGDDLLDAFVWVKPGGESDGTSDSSAARYDSFCGKSDSLQPAPEAGTWFEAYFEQLLKNAVPSFTS